MQNRKSWNRRDGYELRLTSKTIGYLNANAREFLFKGKREGMVTFEREGGNGSMSMVASTDGVKVNKAGHLAVTMFTKHLSTTPLPITVLLTPFEDEPRLLVSGVRK